MAERNIRLEGKVALITGGASGIGKTTAHEFIQHGAHVVIADIDTQLGPQVSNDLGPEAHFVHCDVANESQVAEAVDLTVARHGRLDIMYNNAGISGPALPPSIADLDLHEFDRVMRSTISGLMGGLGPHPYTVSKFAVPGIVKSVASELCRHGVRINCICPSPIPTPLVVGQLLALLPGVTKDRVVDLVNGLGELKGAKCEEIDVARAALYLVSDESKYVTGHNLVVDGGFTCFKHLQIPFPQE
ncbi:NAD(P)-binding Rossmann-fold superfamily protein [Actinidia rufa]|uniref:NAD(P)-binding Rossmann-fold superfamily protein n=1 Tax=Actinidia rufa TaxID=165716 RepID=A0A7J0E9R7_9ERIC|nr:NAD(P)-binding Rossmann-fold superfamily protein [Actinidia rufa]